MCVYIYICIYVCIYVCVCVYMYICVCIYVYMYICIYVYIYVYICVYICVYVYMCVYICVCVYIYIYSEIWKGPKNRSFYLCGVGLCHPPDRWMCSPTWKLSKKFQLLIKIWFFLWPPPTLKPSWSPARIPSSEQKHCYHSGNSRGFRNYVREVGSKTKY